MYIHNIQLKLMLFFATNYRHHRKTLQIGTKNGSGNLRYSSCQDYRVVLNLVHDVMSTTADSNRTRASASSLFIVLREFHLIKAPKTEAIFSVMGSSDIVEQHNIVKRLWHLFRNLFFYKQFDLIEYRNDVICLCRHFRSRMLTTAIKLKRTLLSLFQLGAVHIRMPTLN